MKKVLIGIIFVCVILLNACSNNNNTTTKTDTVTNTDTTTFTDTITSTLKQEEDDSKAKNNTLDPEQDNPNQNTDETNSTEEDETVEVFQNEGAKNNSSPVFNDTAPTTQKVYSSTGKELIIPVPKATKVIVNAVNLSFDKAELNSLENIMNNFNVNVSFFYIDLLSGTTIEARGDIKYASASVIKAPVVKAILDMNPDLDEELELGPEHIHRGAGTIKNQPLGTKFTVRDLIKYTIEESDNTAYKMLCFRYGFDQLNKNAAKLGIKPDQTVNLVFGHLSSRDAALYFQDIYNYAASGDENGKLLVEDLTKASFNELTKKAIPDKTVAEKYGLVSSDLLYHTAAIVYGDRPYVIAVFSNLDDTKGGAEAIRDIITRIDRIHNSIK